MSEQEPYQPVGFRQEPIDYLPEPIDYLPERRNTIVDPAKAEVMAYAEKPYRDTAHVIGNACLLYTSPSPRDS